MEKNLYAPKRRVKRKRIVSASSIVSTGPVSFRNYSIVVGIDPGTHTGITIYNCDTKEYIHCETLKIHQAIFKLQSIIDMSLIPKGMLIIVEDSRNISGPAEKKLGAGSIRRDCSIWEDYLTELVKKTSKDINFLFIRPTNNKYLKMDADLWVKYAKYTWTKMPSEHARDSATYLFKYINS
jgi:hypothetical protein